MGKFTGGLKIALIIGLGVIVPGAALVIGAVGWWTYGGLQGERDKPLVRFARMLSNNDRKVVEMAKALEEEPEKAFARADFSEVVGEGWDPSEDANTTALVYFAANSRFDRARLYERLALFDWKEGGDEVADAFDAMLTASGVGKPSPSERQAILKEARDLAGEYTELPVLIGRYDRFFRSAGLQLTHLNTNSDAYLLVSLPQKAADCWTGAKLPDARLGEGQQLFVEPAIMQSGAFIKDHLPNLLPHIENAAQKPFPKSACLPTRHVLRDMIFGQSEKAPAGLRPTSMTTTTDSAPLAWTESLKPDMPALIDRADRWLRANRPGFYAGLKPGVSDAELDAYERRFGLTLPPELRLVWKWKNGSPDDPLVGDESSDALLHNHRFISLDDSAETEAELDGMIGADFESPEWWKREWIPFTTSWGGDHYAVEISDGKSRVIDFRHDEETRNILAPSFAEWFEQFVATMERGELELS